MNTRRRFQRGFTLIECLVYCSVLVIILTLGLAAFYRVMENSHHLQRNAADIARTLQAGERWRQEIRTASGPVQLVVSNAQPVLRVPRAKGGAIHYTWHKDAVWRAGTNLVWKTFLPGVRSSRMELDQRQQVAAWRWDLELKSAPKVARVSPLFTFEAVAPETLKPNTTTP